MTVNILEHEVSMAEASELLECYTETINPHTGRYHSVMLWGDIGIGKTSVINQLAKRKGRKLILFMTNIREPVDLRGIPQCDEATRTTVWYPPSELPQVERDGAEGYLYIDEINTGSQQMMAVCMQLVLEGRVGDYVLPPGWRVIASGNRVKDKAAAIRMPTALRGRFAHVYCKHDMQSWVSWATTAGVAPELIAFLRFRPEFLHVKMVGDQNASPSPRTWVAASTHVNAPKKHRLRLMAGHVGDAHAAEFDGFIDLYRSIGTLENIAKDPDSAPLPSDPSVRYATMTGLARITDRKNFANVIKYAKRLNHRESEILVVHDATLLQPKLKETSAYGDWAVNNQDLTIQA